MATAGYNSPGKQLTSYIRWYLERHPEVSWRQLLQSAVQHEIQDRVQHERRGEKQHSAPKLSMPRPQPSNAAHISDRELAGQAWLDERLNDYYLRKNWLTGLFSRFSHFIFG